MNPKVLSVRQPYASLIIAGKKRFEARTWGTAYRGALLIHASSAKVSAATMSEFRLRRALHQAAMELGWTTEEAVRALPRSAVIGMVNVRQVYDPEETEDLSVTSLDEDACGGIYGVHLWELEDPIAIDPFPCDGKLKLWDLPAASLKTVLDRMNAVDATASSQAPPVPKASTGIPINLELWKAKPPLNALIGGEHMTLNEAFRAVFNLPTGDLPGDEPQLVLGDTLAFLAPGRASLALPEVYPLLIEYLVRT